MDMIDPGDPLQNSMMAKEKGGRMYSPKIKDDLIPLVYRLARQEGKPMTRLVDEILRAEVERRLRAAGEHSIPDPSGSLKPKKNS